MSEEQSSFKLNKLVSAELLASAVNFSEDAIIITDTELDLPGPRILYVNPAYTRITGYTSAESVGKTPRILQGPKTEPKILKRLRKTIEKGEVFHGQAVNYRKDGTEFVMEWHIEPIRLRGKKITHYMAIQRDVTVRVENEEAVRRQAEELDKKNIALREILHQIELEKKKIQQDVLFNVEETAIPMLKKLRRRGGKLDKNYLDVLEQTLKDLTSGFGHTISEQKMRFSPREIEIANLIKNGLGSKDIADMLNVSLKTIETHRNRIRKKLGLVNQEVNLASYLQGL